MERRSWVIYLSVLFANAFLLAFGIDALISTMDELLKVLTGDSALSGVRNVFAQLAILMSIPALLLLIFVPQLPKLLLIPALMFVWWAVFGLPPFGLHAFEAIKEALPRRAAIAQLGIAVFTFLAVRQAHGGWLLNAQNLPRKNVLVRLFAVSVPFAIGLVAFYLVLTLAAVPAALEEETGDYVRFSSAGVNITERSFRKDGKSVSLIGMIHIGDGDLYQSLYREFPADALVLAEGVTDHSGIMGDQSIGAGRTAQTIGLVGQPALAPTLDKSGAPLPQVGDNVPDEIRELQEVLNESNSVRVAADVLYADIDLSEFSDDTIAFLKGVGEVFSSESLAETLRNYFAFSASATQEEVDAVFDEILYMRNNVLMTVFDEQLSSRDAFIIPWGAMHMPDLEKQLTDRGFVFESETVRPLITYRAIRQAIVRR